MPIKPCPSNTRLSICCRSIRYLIAWRTRTSLNGGTSQRIVKGVELPLSETTTPWSWDDSDVIEAAESESMASTCPARRAFT